MNEEVKISQLERDELSAKIHDYIEKNLKNIERPHFAVLITGVDKGADDHSDTECSVMIGGCLESAIENLFETLAILKDRVPEFDQIMASVMARRIVNKMKDEADTAPAGTPKSDNTFH